MNDRTTMSPKSDCRFAWLSMAFVLLLFPTALRAGIRPEWDPATLTRLADLVVVGQMRANNRIAIHAVLKGETTEKEISIPSLSEFVNEGPFIPSAHKIDLGQEVILFLDQRCPHARVVANGIYRTGAVNSKQGVLGYWQPINPGGYMLKPEIQFDSIAAVRALIQAECKAIPQRQNAALDKVKAAKSNDDFRQALHELDRITRIGDMDILKRIADLDIDDTQRRVLDIVYFIQNVREPRAAQLLEALYSKHRDVSILYALGRLGNPESLAYFESLIDNKQVPKPLFALYGMKELYLSLEAKGDRKNCDMVRTSMYRNVDKDLVDLMMSAPQLISVIPHQGSIERLKRAYEHHAKLRSNAEFEIERHIKNCEEKIKALEKDLPNNAMKATSK